MGKIAVAKTILRSVSIDDLKIARLEVGELTVTGSLTTPAANRYGSSRNALSVSGYCHAAGGRAGGTFALHFNVQALDLLIQGGERASVWLQFGSVRIIRVVTPLKGRRGRRERREATQDSVKAGPGVKGAVRIDPAHSRGCA